jgi:hypothetical protein
MKHEKLQRRLAGVATTGGSSKRDTLPAPPPCLSHEATLGTSRSQVSPRVRDTVVAPVASRASMRPLWYRALQVRVAAFARDAAPPADDDSDHHINTKSSDDVFLWRNKTARCNCNRGCRSGTVGDRFASAGRCHRDGRQHVDKRARREQQSKSLLSRSNGGPCRHERETGPAGIEHAHLPTGSPEERKLSGHRHANRDG